MQFRRQTLPFAAAVSAFAAVALAVTAALDPYIWPSAIVGLLAGSAAGGAVFLFARTRTDTPLGVALGVFGLAFLSLLGVLILLHVDLSVAAPLAGVIAALAGVLSALQKSV